MIGVTVLGSTGSVGVNTLDVLARHPQRFHVVALSGNHQVERLYQQCLAFRPACAVMADEQAATQLAARLRQSAPEIEVLARNEGLEHIATLDTCDYVMAAIVGAAGLPPTLAAARAGKRVMLANKEALVMSGQIFMDEIRRSGAQLLPIDSEHNAIFQCLPPSLSDGLAHNGVSHILLTASGGPFRDTPLEELCGVMPEQAVSHPNWSMGRKISVDSATMMNKGLEVIEVCWLFAADTSCVEVVVHPQSVIHSMVQYVDGSVLAQLGNPDMRTPIAHALAWPERMEAGVPHLDMCDIARLDFQPPDPQRFPCLRLAIEAFEAGGTSSTALNAANEVAVAAFLDHRLAFTGIAAVIEETLTRVGSQAADSLDTIYMIDGEARRVAHERLAVHGVN